MTCSLNQLYSVIGVSKQSVYQAKQRQLAFDRELSELIELAHKLKEKHPGCGVEKMYYTLKPTMMGRDRFCEIFLSLGFGVKPVKNYRRTTIPSGINHPNLIEGLYVYRPFQVIQSDITYFYLNGRHYYLVLIIDVFTRLIVGHTVNDHLRAEANVEALKKAFDRMDFPPWGLIHHSDHGSQYGAKAYLELLKSKQVHVSMGDVAWENPYAERINGIIKNEYLRYWEIKDYRALVTKTNNAVNHYNTKRKHRAFEMEFTPEEFNQNPVTSSPQGGYHLTIYAKDRPDAVEAPRRCEIHNLETFQCLLK